MERRVVVAGVEPSERVQLGWSGVWLLLDAEGRVVAVEIAPRAKTKGATVAG